MEIPIITTILTTINCFVHVVIFLFTLPLNLFSLNAYQVIHGDYYRIISAAFVHSGILHLLINMSSLLSLGQLLELQFGSLQFAFMTLWTVVLVGLLYVCFSWSITKITNNPYQMQTSAVGYSGVLFSYLVIESYHALTTNQILFGYFSVPTRLVPLLMLILLQVLVPNISLLGHLSGLIIGMLTICGLMSVLIPSKAFLSSLEEGCLRGVARVPMYVRCTDKDFTAYSYRGGPFQIIKENISYLLETIRNIFEAIFHILGLQYCYTNMCNYCCNRNNNSNNNNSNSNSNISSLLTYCCCCFNCFNNNNSGNNSSSSSDNRNSYNSNRNRNVNNNHDDTNILNQSYSQLNKNDDDVNHSNVNNNYDNTLNNNYNNSNNNNNNINNNHNNINNDNLNKNNNHTINNNNDNLNNNVNHNNNTTHQINNTPPNIVISYPNETSPLLFSNSINILSSQLPIQLPSQISSHLYTQLSKEILPQDISNRNNNNHHDSSNTNYHESYNITNNNNNDNNNSSNYIHNNCNHHDNYNTCGGDVAII